MRLSDKARNALFIGTLCSVSYFAVYIARNVLSAVTPQMIASGFSEAYIGKISALYFVFYAIGQLLNGAIGDKIKAKWMICLGLGLASVSNMLFVNIAAFPGAAYIVYPATGFFLSMIYGPMTKIVSENTEPHHAVRCSLGYTFASFFGSPTAGLLASFLAWQSVFAMSSAALILMAVIGFIFFTVFERKGIVEYGRFKRAKEGRGSIKLLLSRDIVRFSFVSILTGIVRTSVVFWLPTYIAQYLGFAPNTSASIFTAATLVISLSAFVTVFIYERLHRNVKLSLTVMFSSAALFFALTYLVSSPLLNVCFIVLAILSSNCAASVLWSIYCPGLYDTGMVSTATGFLDFLSYMAAALANILFANAATTIGWANLVLIWLALALVGVFVSLPIGRFKHTGSPKSQEKAL